MRFLRVRISLFFSTVLLGVCVGNMATAWGADDASPDTAPDQPNILFIFTDDHACHAISAYGSKINQTPNIDRIANEGALFLNNFCGNSICGPSRATVLTGLHTHANGMMTNHDRFDGSQQTFPKLLQRVGYTTAVVGKWHLKTEPTGFDYWDILQGQGQYYSPVFVNSQGKRTVPGYATDVTTDLALEWLEETRDAEKPFLLMLQHKAPHRTWMPGPKELDLYTDIDIPEPATLFDDYEGRGPAAAVNEMEIDRHMRMAYDLQYHVDKKTGRPISVKHGRMSEEELAVWNAAFDEENEAFWKAKLTGKDLVRWKYQRYIKNYLRCIAGVDRNVGRVLEYLDENDLADNTIVIYCSDQGFYLGDHGWFDKRWMYEESLRMPLCVRWPGKIKPGTKVKALTQNIDFAPSFLEVAGATADTPMHGQSLVTLLDDDPTNDITRDALYYHYYEHAEHNVAKHYGVRTNRYKLMYFYQSQYDYYELYDLEKDPQEMKSVFNDPAYAEVAKDLQSKTLELRKQFGDNTGRPMSR